MSSALMQVHDGVGTAVRGNLLLTYYGADASLERTRWVFDRADELAAGNPDGILCLMVISSTVAPPDGPTRAENEARLEMLDSKMQLLVTVPLGDTIMRALLRTMIPLQGKRARHVIVASEREGIRRLLELASPQTPSRSEIEADLSALRAKVQQAT
jgi:hypothetical protein